MSGARTFLHRLKIHGTEIDVFDDVKSLTTKWVSEEFEKRDPLALIPKDARVILDIGANVGIYSFLCAKHFPQAQIYAVEPHPGNIKHLQIGIAEGGYTNVHLLPFGVAPEAGPIELLTDETNSGSATQFEACFALSKHLRAFTRAWASAVTLNQIFEKIIVPESPDSRMVDHVKVDIEGAEFYLFQGFRHFDRIRSMNIETHPFHAEQPDTEAKAAEIREMVRGYIQIVTKCMNGRGLTFTLPDEMVALVREEQWWKGATKLSHEDTNGL